MLIGLEKPLTNSLLNFQDLRRRMNEPSTPATPIYSTHKNTSGMINDYGPEQSRRSRQNSMNAKSFSIDPYRYTESRIFDQPKIKEGTYGSYNREGFRVGADFTN